MRDEEILASEGIRPLRRVEYERLVECGAFADERIELLRGMLVRMSPQGERHWKSIALLHKLLILSLGDRADVVGHSPFAADEDSEPEPDLMVIPSIASTRGAPSHALLVVEASDSSLRKDRKLKGPLYAASRVPEYWILDLNAGEVEVYRDPGPGPRGIPLDDASWRRRHARARLVSRRGRPRRRVPASRLRVDWVLLSDLPRGAAVALWDERATDSFEVPLCGALEFRGSRVGERAHAVDGPRSACPMRF